MRRLKKAIRQLSEEELLPSFDDFQPLETPEQVEMVESFEKSHTLQNAVWRGIFSSLLFSFAGFFIYSAHRQSVSPWDVCWDYSPSKRVKCSMECNIGVQLNHEL